MNSDDLFTPPDHVGFRARKLYKGPEALLDAAIAYLEPSGGGQWSPPRPLTAR